MNWIIEPYAGVDRLRFGMTSKAVETIAGVCRKSRLEIDGSMTEFRNVAFPKLCYENGMLSEITFGSHARGVWLGELAFYELPGAEFAKQMLALDKDLRLSGGGSIISNKFGISFNDYDTGESNKSLTAFRKGVFDDILRTATPFTLDSLETET